MQAFLERHRSLAGLILALFLQLLLLGYQIKTENEIRLIRIWAVTLITPVEKGIDFLADGLRGVWHSYVALYDAQRENRRLWAELDQARLRLHELEARATQAEQLAALLALKQAHPQAPLIAAEVIGSSAVATSRTIFINQGRDNGVERNMAVLTPDGIVGKVIQTFPGSAQVLLITDRDSGVGALLADSRVQGVVKGTGRLMCRLDYVPNENPVAVGARVLTSGQDQLYPKGYPVGTVVSVRQGEYLQEIFVRPAAKLNQLEYVFVLAGPPETLTVAAAGSSRE